MINRNRTNRNMIKRNRKNKNELNKLNKYVRSANFQKTNFLLLKGLLMIIIIII